MTSMKHLPPLVRSMASAVLASFALAACALGSTEPAETSTSPLAFCNARAEAECAADVVKRCGVPSRDECVRVRSDDCMGRAPQGATVRAPLVGTCLGRVTKAYQDATITAEELRAIRTDCDAVWTGPGELKSACKVDSDCDTAAGLACVVPLGSATEVQGTCLKPHRVQSGDACDGPADVCPADAYCDGKTATCLARRVEGQQCHEWLAPCLAGLTCPGSTSPFASAKCTPRGEDGAPCSRDAECGSDLCLRVAKTPEGTCASEVVLNAIDSVCAGFKN